ncbi:N-acetylglucosamine-6-phosphate deacetylase [Paraflavitalea pollutisoli]|uniref:N-acetylglucosamine-6-phosphate deacetylase n=1 Tax=Paraflavitalea pollutisoli TaxID=3034143 RepID=UPI0023EE20FC|nr:N-acetylglucosamine-6-phosphate deacetylase [Paraflavitalea sp. H1-2-19X]
MQKLKIFNGTVLTPRGRLRDGIVYVENGKIVEVSDRHTDAADYTSVDAAGKYITPGFIDIHVHGGGNADFMDATPEAFIQIAATHARHGTTSMTPTTLTAEASGLYKTLDAYDMVKGMQYLGADLIGMHLEGPYFALNQRGAQDPRYIRNPDPAEYRAILDYSPHIVRWSAAPELPGAIEFGRYIKERGILPAIAHTDALYDDVVKARAVGYTLATHFYSAMSGVTRKDMRRYAGVIESVYLLDDIDAEIIADGVHLPAALLQLIIKVKGIAHTVLITDAMRAAGMPPGKSILGPLEGGLEVLVDEEVAMLPDRTSFAGSIATADRLIRTMLRLAGVSLEDAVKMMTENPARVMGIADTKGALTKDRDADIIIFDDNINIDTTIVKGHTVYTTQTAAV